MLCQKLYQRGLSRTIGTDYANAVPFQHTQGKIFDYFPFAKLLTDMFGLHYQFGTNGSFFYFQINRPHPLYLFAALLTQLLQSAQTPLIATAASRYSLVKPLCFLFNLFIQVFFFNNFLIDYFILPFFKKANPRLPEWTIPRSSHSVRLDTWFKKERS